MPALDAAPPHGGGRCGISHRSVSPTSFEICPSSSALPEVNAESSRLESNVTLRSVIPRPSSSLIELRAYFAEARQLRWYGFDLLAQGREPRLQPAELALQPVEGLFDRISVPCGHAPPSPERSCGIRPASQHRRDRGPARIARSSVKATAGTERLLELWRGPGDPLREVGVVRGLRDRRIRGRLAQEELVDEGPTSAVWLVGKAQ